MRSRRVWSQRVRFGRYEAHEAVLIDNENSADAATVHFGNGVIDTQRRRDGVHHSALAIQ